VGDDRPTLDEFDRRSQPPSDQAIQAVAELLQRAGVDPAEVGRIDKVRLSEYQTAYKDTDGEAHVLDLRAASVVLTPAWETGPEWPVVDQARPAKVMFGGRVAKVPPAADGLKRLLVLPDPQIGYSLDHAGQPEAFHDDAALDVAVTLARTVRPDAICCLGDLLDLPAVSKYRKLPSWALMTQAAIDRAHDWLAALSAIAPVDLIEGNHDARLMHYVLDNAAAAFGLKRANAPKDWPTLSVPYLLRLDELGVNYLGGYPVGIAWYAPNLACIHGTKLKMSQVLDDERVCVVQGHTHKAAVAYKQRLTMHGPSLMWAASPGCLCRTDGAVPGVNVGHDQRTGRSINRPQDWHQGCAVVTFDPTGERLPVYEFVPINSGTARWRDYVIEVSP
jgi:hypothetical protein